MNATVERDYEQEARAQGWRPQEEFEGDNWVDAKTFVERGEKYVGIMKSRVDSLENQLREIKQTNQALKSQYQRMEQAKAKEIDGLIKQLESVRKQAITNGDGEAFDRAERELDAARKQKQQIQETAAQPAATPAWATAWIAENPWYGKDLAATAVAERVAVEIRDANPNMTETEFLGKVAERVKAELPERFTNPKNKTSSIDADIDSIGSRTTGTVTTGPGYKALPQEAKSEFNRLVREKIFKNTDEDRQRFADLYNE